MTTLEAPLCYFCKHLHNQYALKLTCDAFPDGVPPEALHPVGPAHRLPINGDHGIQFEQDAQKSTAPATATHLGQGFDRPEIRLLSELLDRLNRAGSNPLSDMEDE